MSWGRGDPLAGASLPNGKGEADLWKFLLGFIFPAHPDGEALGWVLGQVVESTLFINHLTTNLLKDQLTKIGWIQPLTGLEQSVAASLWAWVKTGTGGGGRRRGRGTGGRGGARSSLRR